MSDRCTNCRHNRESHMWTANLDFTVPPADATEIARNGPHVEYSWRCVAPCTCQQWKPK